VLIDQIPNWIVPLLDSGHFTVFYHHHLLNSQRGIAFEDVNPDPKYEFTYRPII